MKHYTTTQAAERLKISGTLVRRYCAEGRLGEKVGSTYIISEESLAAFEKVQRKRGRPRGKDGDEC